MPKIPHHRHGYAGELGNPIQMGEQFLPLALLAGLADLDAAAVRECDARGLTQAISAWIYEIVGAGGDRINDIQYVATEMN